MSVPRRYVDSPTVFVRLRWKSLPFPQSSRANDHTREGAREFVSLFPNSKRVDSMPLYFRSCATESQQTGNSGNTQFAKLITLIVPLRWHRETRMPSLPFAPARRTTPRCSVEAAECCQK